MVYFDCASCGESLKKNQVEKHYQFKCRSCNTLSCADCGKSFHGEEYKQHTVCITEAEKHGGKNFVPKANANKGEKKQNEWVNQVQAAIDNVTDRSLKGILERVIGYTNIPRKKAKFVNFLKNSLRLQGNMADRAWDAISTEIAKNQSEAAATNGNSNGTTSTNGNAANGVTENTNQSNKKESGSQDGASTSEEAEKKLSKRERKLERQKKDKKEKKDRKTSEATEEEEEPVKKKSKKRKRQEMEEEEEEVTEEVQKEKSKKKKKKKGGKKEEDMEAEEVPKKKKKVEEVVEEEQEEEEEEEPVKPKGKFQWEQEISAILRKADDHELSIKKLRKKVMGAYQDHGASNLKTEEDFLSKFNKKIKKSAQFKVAKDRVKLL